MLINGYLLNPFCWIILVFVLSYFQKNAKWKKRGITFGIFLFLVLSNPWLSNFVFHLWEYETIQVTDIQEPYDIGIVLGPFINDRKNLPNNDEIVTGVSRRLTQSIELYKLGKIKKLLLSGADNMDKTKLFVMRLGVPEKDIWTEDLANNTYENALYSKQFLHEKNTTTKKILLLTSASHMRRAKKCFDKVGLYVIPFSIDYKTSCKSTWELDLLDIVPHDYTFGRWRLLLRESLSLLYFKLKGYI